EVMADHGAAFGLRPPCGATLRVADSRRGASCYIAEAQPMNQDRFTEKSLEALQTAQRLASKFQHQQMDVEHLLLGLLDQDHGLAGAILNKAQVATDAVKIKLQRELEKLPRVTGAGDNVSIAGRLNRLLGVAEDEAKKMKDDYVSI